MYDLEVILSTAGILIVYYTYVQSMCVCTYMYVHTNEYICRYMRMYSTYSYTCTFT